MARYNDAGMEISITRCWTILLNFRLDLHHSNMMGEIIEIMLLRTQDQDEEVAINAIEFWLSLAHKPFCKEILDNSLLERLLENLVRRLHFSEKELSRLNRDNEDGNGLFFNIAFSEWSSRKCSAAVLEQLARSYGDDLPPLLVRPSFKEFFYQPGWENKECVILATGLVSEGCMKGMKAERPTLIPWLERRLWTEIAGMTTVPVFLISCTCWTIGRYANLVVSESESVLADVIRSLLRLMLDENRRVQGSACTAFTLIEVEAGPRLVHYLKDIKRTLVEAFGKYNQKNTSVLFDCVGALANSVGQQLNGPSYPDLLLSTLMEKWNDLSKDEDQPLLPPLLPLLRCLSSVTTALQSGFKSHGETVFLRCVSIIKRTLDQLNAYESVELEFMTLALELITSLTEELTLEVEPHIGPSNLIDLLLDVIQYDIPEVRQSVFGLLGSLTKTCFRHVVPFIRVIVLLSAENLDPEIPSVCTNAIWVLGEISVKLGIGMANSIAPFHLHCNIRNKTPLIDIMNRPNTPKTLLENTAITIGRLGWVCTPNLSIDLQKFARQWFTTMCNIPDGNEKVEAWRGMCNLIVANPNGISKDFFFFCHALATWRAPPLDLRRQFQRILQEFKNTVHQDKWNQFINQIDFTLRQNLWQQYRV